MKIKNRNNINIVAICLYDGFIFSLQFVFDRFEIDISFFLFNLYCNKIIDDKVIRTNINAVIKLIGILLILLMVLKVLESTLKIR